MNADYSSMNKVQKVASFLICVGPEAAAEVMRHFDNAQLELICREMASIPYVDEKLRQSLMAEFSDVVSSGLTSVLGGVNFVQRTLERAKGDYTASAIINRVAPVSRSMEAGEEIRQMEGRQVLNLMKSEQPQTIAFIMSFMDTPKAAELISILSPELREEVVERLGAMETTSRDTVSKVARNLNRHFDKRTHQHGMMRSGGVKACADLLNALDKEMRKVLLVRIEERNPALGAAIRKKVFSFEDIARLAPVDLQRVLREIDMADLPIALKSAKPLVITAVMGAMSKRAAESLKEELEMLGPQKVKDVEAAQDRIITVIRRLEEAEEITIDTGGDENVFA